MNTKNRAEPSKRATLVAAAVVLSLIGGVLYGIEALWDATTGGTSTTASQGVSEPVEDELSETERLAAQVAAKFDTTWRDGPFTPPAAAAVTGFARDLDPWDGSIAVTTNLYSGAAGEELAPQVGAAVLAVAFPLGICKVDVLASNHTRLVEHESQGRGC